MDLDNAQKVEALLMIFSGAAGHFGLTLSAAWQLNWGTQTLLIWTKQTKKKHTKI